MQHSIHNLLELHQKVDSLTSRLDLFSSELLNSPYQANPLCGSHDTPEQFVCDISHFDCVTYVETVLALSFASSEKDFLSTLQRLRYHNGTLSWSERNHYMTDWILRNGAQGFLEDLTPSLPPSFTTCRTLSCLPHYPAREHTLFFCSPQDFEQTSHLLPGDIVFFGSTREDLDIFHLGLLFPTENGKLLRHASQKMGKVTEEPLTHFLAREEVFGLQLVRPHND
ncbi:MAG: DUF1460 domain-containing protein [Bdellovibrionales bacterium]|nr:DUF1460 domain-containing protein [Bdellovibrionales bacterium]